jgi:hypothetical protein
MSDDFRSVGLGQATSLPVARAAPVPRAVGQLLTTTLRHAAPIVWLVAEGHPGGLLRSSCAFRVQRPHYKRPDPAESHPIATAVVVLTSNSGGRVEGLVALSGLDGHDYEAVVIHWADLDGGCPVCCGASDLGRMIC